MTTTANRSLHAQAATVVGGGICGSWAALLLCEAGLAVTLHDRDGPDMAAATSHWAGGMLAPDCESDAAEPVVVRLGRRSVALWREHMPDVPLEGSLVVSHPRDRGDLDRLGRQTSGHRTVAGDELARLEPALAGRFRTGLYYPDEGHVEPRVVLPALREKLAAGGGVIRLRSEVDPAQIDGLVIDCRGLGARRDLPALRGVKGETVLVESADIALGRPVRLMHPRWPIYVIPRRDNRFLIGASTVESEDMSGVSVRSALELMTAAYALHPAFGEARIVELGTALRPAFPDHGPRIAVEGSRISVNGLYRHGFLLAPALAELVATYVTTGARDNEVMQWN